MATPKNLYTTDQAIVIAKQCIKAYQQWGQHADYPYHPYQFVELMKALYEGGNFDGVSREEHNRVIGQLNAANARAAKANKQ